MSHSRKPVLTSELLASRQPFCEGVYVVGPFASRVSFSSQQRRAISLVCDIDSDLKSAGDEYGIRGKRICIVGAGISGLTCAVAVAALDGSAYVHEKRLQNAPPLTGHQVTVDEVLSTIRYAAHRDAHPTLNFWPHEDIEPFTRLPFLNWHEGDCSSVAEQFVEELNSLMSHKSATNRISIRTGFNVTSIEQGAQPGKLRPVYALDGGAPPAWDMDFDLVILATGFGIETTAPGAEMPSYWSPEGDCIPALREAMPTQVQHYIVSGTGDGGLIEALRLTFRDLRAGNIGGNMEAALGVHELKTAIARIENRAHKLYADNILHGEPMQPNAATREALACSLWEEYSAIVELIKDPVVRELQEARSNLPPILLLGEWSFPMELSASPYHRLLLRVAIEYGWITYRKARGVVASSLERSVQIVTGDGTRNIPIYTISGEFWDTDAKMWVQKDHLRSFFIARYGYTSPLKALYNDEKLLNQIKRQQSLYADQDALIVDRAREMAAKFGHPDPGDARAFYDRNRGRIKRYFSSKFSAQIRLTEKPDDHFEIRPGIRGQLDRAVPTKLFGLEILEPDDELVDSFDNTGVGL